MLENSDILPHALKSMNEWNDKFENIMRNYASFVHAFMSLKDNKWERDLLLKSKESKIFLPQAREEARTASQWTINLWINGKLETIVINGEFLWLWLEDTKRAQCFSKPVLTLHGLLKLWKIHTLILCW